MLALSVSAHPVLAAEKTEGAAYSEISLSRQLDLCTLDRRANADKTLNTTYRSLLIRIENAYLADPPLSEKFKTSVKQSQLAWIKFRDLNCAVKAIEAEPGSAAYQTLFSQCVTEMSNSSPP